MRRGHTSAKPQGAQTSVYVSYLQTETKSYTTLSMIGLYTGRASRWITTLLSAFGPKARGSPKRCRWSKRGLLRAYWYSTGITWCPQRGAYYRTLVALLVRTLASCDAQRSAPTAMGLQFGVLLVCMLGGADTNTWRHKKREREGEGMTKKGDSNLSGRGAALWDLHTNRLPY